MMSGWTWNYVGSTWTKTLRSGLYLTVISLHKTTWSCTCGELHIAVNAEEGKRLADGHAVYCHPEVDR